MGSIYRRAGTYWIKYYRGGRPHRESAHTDKVTEAKRLLALREGQVVEGRFPGLRVERVRIEELAKDYVRDYEINGRTSIKDAQRYVRVFTEVFGPLRVVELRSDQIAAYIDQRRKAGAANATINRELGALRRMLNLGAKQHPPKVLHVPVIPRLREEAVRTGFFEHDEFLSMRGALPDHQKVPLTLGYWTGMRRGEILKLQWTQVDLERGLLRLDPGTTKNGEGRVLPLVTGLRSVLEQWRRYTLLHWPSCPWVCHYDGAQLTRLTRAWRRAARQVGLEGKLFHDLRRTAVRNMVRSGIPERVAMTISGHKTRSVFDRYDIVNERDLHEAAARLSAHFSRLTPRGLHDRQEPSFSCDGHNLGTMQAHQTDSVAQLLDFPSVSR
jgi:integrase